MYLGLGRNPRPIRSSARRCRAARTDRPLERGDRGELERPRRSVCHQGKIDSAGRPRTGGRWRSTGAVSARGHRAWPARCSISPTWPPSRGQIGPAPTRSPRRRSRSPGDIRRAPPRRRIGLGPEAELRGRTGNLAKAESTGRRRSRSCATSDSSGTRRWSRFSAISLDAGRTRGDITEALTLTRQTVSLDTALFGTSHPYLAAHLENLVSCTRAWDISTAR